MLYSNYTLIKKKRSSITCDFTPLYTLLTFGYKHFQSFLYEYTRIIKICITCMKIYYKNGVLLCTYIYMTIHSLEHNLKCLNSTLEFVQ